MSKIDIVRAWKDEFYRNSLSVEERAMLPENPAGLIVLTDEDLGLVAGGIDREPRTVNVSCGETSHLSCDPGSTVNWDCVPFQTFEWQCLTRDYTQACTTAVPEC